MQNNTVQSTECAILYLTLNYHQTGKAKMDNSDILDIDRGPATPQFSKEAIMGSLKVT